MFTFTWNKYLPVIKILLKRAATGEQVLNMNQTDFNRAAGGRKVKYAFQVKIRRGRLEDAGKASPIARQLVEALLIDENTKKLARENDFDISMNNQYQLTITQTSTRAEKVEESPEE